jgi:hypothetical protein
VIKGLWAAATVALIATGCGSLEAHRTADPFATFANRVDLDATPFFPQEKHQCGPAALATVLTASGLSISAEELVPRVYVPARRGSLQVEMLATTRASGRIPFVIEPKTQALAREVAGGNPVLVLLNLGIKSWPRWHYAVVVGFDSTNQVWWLRSGNKRRDALGLRRFEGAWRRAEYWGFVALEPGKLPSSDNVDRYVAAVAEFERFSKEGAATRAYEAALARGPQSVSLRFGLGNALLADGRRADAEAAFRATLVLDPNHVPARNNLADALRLRGCRAEALQQIALALRASAGSPYEAAVRDTLAQIEATSPDLACENAPAN